MIIAELDQDIWKVSHKRCQIFDNIFGNKTTIIVKIVTKYLGGQPQSTRALFARMLLKSKRTLDVCYPAVASHEVVHFVSCIESSIHVCICIFFLLGVFVFVFVFLSPDQIERTLGVCNGFVAVMK